MKKSPVRFSIFPSLRRLPLFIVAVILVASCQFPGLGEEPPCGQSVLKIGENTYQIEAIQTKSDGSLKIPSNSPGMAYWVNDTAVNYVFALSPTENNLALRSSLKDDAQATITWDNCNTVTFNLSAPQPGAPDQEVLLSQAVSGITIFIQPASVSAGFVIQGELAEETISAFNTPDTAQAQAEISILETTASADGKTILLRISVLNFGQSSFMLLPTDISLTPENAAALTLLTSDPAIPYEIKPGETAAFDLTFPHPSTETAILKILSVEYEIAGY